MQPGIRKQPDIKDRIELVAEALKSRTGILDLL
jgi:hypothetical protein